MNTKLYFCAISIFTVTAYFGMGKVYNHEFKYGKKKSQVKKNWDTGAKEVKTSS